MRRVLSGEFTVVNQHLLMDLTRLGLWSADLKNELVAANGSVQVSCLPLNSCLMQLCSMPESGRVAQELDIPEELKALYKTVWEIKQRKLVDMSADRGAYIDQSQSFNVHMSDPNFGKLTSLHFHAWKVGAALHRPVVICHSRPQQTRHPNQTLARRLG